MGSRLSLVEKTIILFYFVSPFLYLIRVLFGDTTLGFVLLRAMQPILILVVIGALFFKKIKYDFFFLVTFILFMYGVFVGFINGNKPYDILTGGSHFIVGFLLYLYYKNNQLGDERVLRFLQVTLVAYLFSITVVILTIYIMREFFEYEVYLGLACQVLIPLACYALYKRSYFLVTYILLLVVLSGKRGVLVAMFVGFSIYLIPLCITFYRRFLAKYLVLIVFLSPIILVFNLNFIDSLVNKIKYDETQTINEYSSGRIDEIASAFNYWTLDTNRTLLGSGFGFTYTYVSEDNSLPNVDNYKNVHFSYINPMIIFGGVWGFVYIIIYFSLVIKVILKKVNKNSVHYPLKISVISYTVYACFAFVLFNEPLLWAMLGIISTRRI